MATALDFGLVSYFSIIFPILLVFVVTYAVLTKSKLFGENQGIHGLIAFALAMMLLFSRDAVAVISTMAPWFVLIFIFIILAMITLQFLGVEGAKVTAYMSGEWTAVHWIFLAVVLIILIGSLGSVFGGALLPFTDDGTATVSDADGGLSADTGDFNQNVGRTIFHPKVLGLIFLFLIGAATIRMVSVS